MIDCTGSAFYYQPYNKQLTNRACSGRTGEYWPSVVAVRPEQARLVSCLVYGTLFLIVKCNGTLFLIVWHSVPDSELQLQKRFVTESDKSIC